MTVNVSRLELRIGDQWNFEVAITNADTGVAIPIDARYSKAKLVIRATWSEARAQLLLADETTGLAIDHAGGIINASIGAVLTGAIPSVRDAQPVACLLRLYNDNDANDTQSYPIPLLLQPDLIA